MVRSIGVGGGGLPLASCILDGFQQRDLAGRAVFAIVAGEFGVAEFGPALDGSRGQSSYADIGRFASICDYQRPPAASIATSKARLLSVRRLPEFRGMTTSPTAMRRRMTSCPKSASDMPCGLRVKIGNSIFVRSFFANPSFQIANIFALIKPKQRTRLGEHIRGAA